MFQTRFSANIEVNQCKQTKILYWDGFETSNKLNKIWLKELNPHIYKVEGLN